MSEYRKRLLEIAGLTEEEPDSPGMEDFEDNVDDTPDQESSLEEACDDDLKETDHEEPDGDEINGIEPADGHDETMEELRAMIRQEISEVLKEKGKK